MLPSTFLTCQSHLLARSSWIFPLSFSLTSLGVEVAWTVWAARKELEELGVEQVTCGSVLRFSLGRGDSARRTEPGLEAGSLGGSGGGCSAIFIKVSSLEVTAQLILPEIVQRHLRLAQSQQTVITTGNFGAESLSVNRWWYRGWWWLRWSWDDLRSKAHSECGDWYYWSPSRQLGGCSPQV